jgi:type II secretory pathway pseudopilin PulG
MAALLVAMSVAAVLMTAVMPTWRHLAQRDREEEMIFRAKQYARAVGLYQRKAGPGVLPPNLDVLVDQKFLRKKYTDPLTNGEFELLYATPPAPAGQAPTAATPGRGGIIGVKSKSKEKSIRVVDGRTSYSEMSFVYVAQTSTAGPTDAPGPGGGRGGNGRGAQGRSGQPSMGQQFGGRGSFGSGAGGLGAPPAPSGQGPERRDFRGPVGQQPAPGRRN